MEVIGISVLVIVVVCLGCTLLIRSGDWLTTIKAQEKKKKQKISETNEKLDSLQVTLDKVNPILEKTNDIFTKIKES